MKILRLSLFNLKKNKREAIAIAFLTLVTTMMLSIVVSNKAKIDTVFDDSFAASGSFKGCVSFRADKYRDAFKEILEDEYGIKDIAEGHMLMAAMTDTLTPDGGTVSYNFIFATEKTDRKMEKFKKGDHLPENEIESLEHPVWMPVSFQIVKGFKPGDTFTILKGGKEYPFTIAGFYETGLLSSDYSAYKLILSEEDYALFTMLFESSTAYEVNSLFFDPVDDFDVYEYLDRCSEKVSENISGGVLYSCYENEKLSETFYLNLFQYVIIFLALVTMVAALIVIRHKISNDIEDQMQQIGVLEALGYRSGEISLSYVYEYMIAGGIGSLLGGIMALLSTPLVNRMIGKMMGRNVYGRSGLAWVFVIMLLVIIVVVLFALIKAGIVKRYPPVVAFRKGIRTHHFGRNILPLEKIHTKINLALSLKAFFGSLRSGIGIMICVTVAGTAMFFSVVNFDFFKNGTKGFESIMGRDVNAVSVHVRSGVDPWQIREEILNIPEVRKAFVMYDTYSISVKNSSNYSMLSAIYEDYDETENIHPYMGRCPRYDNEVMIGEGRRRRENIGIGDSLVLECNGIEKKYIVTGIVNTMLDRGMDVYLTSKGYEKINCNAREDVVAVYPKDGVSLEELEEAVTAYFDSNTALKNTGGEDSGEDIEERIRTAANEKISVLLSQYGVTDVDYAVQIGDELYTGNSRDFRIKEITSYKGSIKTQLEPMSLAFKNFTLAGAVMVAVIVAVILVILTSGDVRRQRESLGIMKGLGYSSRDLMIQMAIKIMPVTIVGVVLANVCTIYLNRFFWNMACNAVAVTNIPVMIITGALLILFSFLVTYISAGRIKKISVNELMSE